MDLIDIKGIGKATIEKLKELNIFSVKELVQYLPAAYVDLTKCTDIVNVQNGGYYLINGIIESRTAIKRSRKANYFKAKLISCDKKIELIWYNQPYMYDRLIAGQEYTVFGKIVFQNKLISIANPVFEVKGEEKKLKGIMSIYRTQGLIHQANIRKYILEALNSLKLTSLTDDMAIDINKALLLAHKPSTTAEGYAMQRRLAVEEIVNTIINYRIIKDKSILDKNRKYNDIDYSILLSLLPYKLTSSQVNAIKEIINDLLLPIPMNRMLIGDVGSGKTIVALIVAYIVIKSGYKVAILAPTTILAKQHYESARLLSNLGCSIELLTGDTSDKDKREINNKLKSGLIDLLIGTHSIFDNDIEYNKLALIITDEMHRFGVNQKNSIEMKGNAVDTLVMSATPIPRALQLIMFNDLKVSRLDRRQEYRIKTSIVPEHKRGDMFNFLLKEIQAGRQGYIVCPRIEDVEGIEIDSAKNLYLELSKGVLKGIKIGLLHGKLNAENKEKMMNDFKDKTIQAIVSTTVIEVGIDVPNATVMIIMNAEMFGLAALHQLRGRIGRGEHMSHCFLYTSDVNNLRLKALKEHDDGQKISDVDYDIRGGGDFIGLRQSGKVFRKGYIIDIDRDLIIEAKQVADRIIIDENVINKFETIKSEQIEEIVKKVTMN